jgi:O-antigen/teichoic acid export membrane protein
LRFRIQRLRQLARFSGGAAGIGLAGVLLTHLDRVFASRLLTLEHFGYYSIAATIGRTVHLLIAPVHAVLFPRLTALASRRDGAALKHAYSLGTQTMCAAVFPLAAVVIWMNYDLAFAWLGDVGAASAVAGIAGFIAAGSALNGLMHLPFALQLAHGHTKPAVAISIGLLLAAVPTAYALFNWLGPVGLAATWLLVNLVYVVVGVPLTHRIVQLGSVLRWVRNDVAVPIAVSLASVGMAHALLGDAADRIGSAVNVVIGIAAGYVLTILAAKRIRTEILALALRRPPRI